MEVLRLLQEQVKLLKQLLLAFLLSALFLLEQLLIEQTLQLAHGRNEAEVALSENLLHLLDTNQRKHLAQLRQ